MSEKREVAVLLKGVRILDFSRYFPGPLATQRLADWGAVVIKVEDPRGDPGRILGSRDGSEGAVFRSVNRGKRSVVANLKDPTHQQIILDLAAEADVVLDGFRPGVMKRLGMDYEAVSAVNPTIVYCALTGYGQDGPNSRLSGHDINYQALAGLLDQLLDTDGNPIKPQIALADLIGGVAASEAILSGLVNRWRSGEGSFLDVSLTEATFSLLGLHATNASCGGGHHGVNDESISYNIYRTRDGRWITLGAMEDKFWEAFCIAVGAEDLIPAKNTPARAGEPAYERMVSIAASRDFDQWREFFRTNDCCFAPVLSIQEATSERGFVNRAVVGTAWGAEYIASHFCGRTDFLAGDAPFPAIGELADLTRGEAPTWE